MGRDGTSRHRSRRRFLRLTAVGAAMCVAGCGTDGVNGDGDETTKPTTGGSGAVAAESASSGGGGHWPQFQYDAANTGRVPDERVPGDDIGVVWRAEMPGPIDAAPAVVDGRVFVGSGDGTEGTVAAFESASGDPLWSVAMASGADADPAVVDGTVYVGHSAGGLLALDAESGDERWRYGDSSKMSTPTVADGVVYVGPAKREVHAVDAESGDAIWTASVEGTVPSTPAVADGRVYVVSSTVYEPKVAAFDASSGRVLWRRTLVDDPIELSFPAPAVAAGRVYVGTTGGSLYALDAASGETLWVFETPDGAIVSSPAVGEDAVYTGCKDGNCYAVDAVTGEQRWSFDAGGRIYASPVVADGTVLVGSFDGSLSAVDAESGDELWHRSVGEYVRTSVAVADGRIYGGSWNGLFYALS